MSTRSGRRMPPPERIYIRIVLQEGRISSKTINRPAAACLSRLGVLFTPVEYYERMQIDAYYILSISMTGTVQYGLRRCISSPPLGGFPSSGNQPRGCQDRTMRLRKALAEIFPTPAFFWHRHYSDCYCVKFGGIDHGKSAQGCVIRHGRIRYCCKQALFG